nr:hypothetical protein Iba_chr12fCG17760 [Ipomoea batatas]
MIVGSIKIHTDLSTKALQSRDKNIGSKKPAHSLASIHGKLPAMEILVNVVRITIIKRHVLQRRLTNTLTAAGATVGARAALPCAVGVAGAASLLCSCGGDQTTDPMLLDDVLGINASAATVNNLAFHRHVVNKLRSGNFKNINPATIDTEREREKVPIGAEEKKGMESEMEKRAAVIELGFGFGF